MENLALIHLLNIPIQQDMYIDNPYPTTPKHSNYQDVFTEFRVVAFYLTSPVSNRQEILFDDPIAYSLGQLISY